MQNLRHEPTFANPFYQIDPLYVQLKSILTPPAGQAFLKKHGHSPHNLGAPAPCIGSTFALKSERQRRYDRHNIGVSSWWLTPSLSEPAREHGPGIVGDIGERSDAHPV
jgi:hypothetical protein